MFKRSETGASAKIDQDGRDTGTTTVDGNYARVTGNAFNPNANQCVIYSALTYDSTAPRQMEAGLVRCNGASIDGTCPGGQVFVERYNGTSYFCTPGYSFTNGTEYDATTYRSSGTTFTGAINGASNSQGGFGLTDHTQGYAWGEATGGSTCPSPNHGTFTIWQRYDSATGWHTVNGSSIFRSGGGMTGAPCWPTVSATASSGGFDVN